jgi:cyclase
MNYLVNRTLIVAKIVSGKETDVARIFAESDRTSLPAKAGVIERSLYSLNDLYIHLIDFEKPGTESITAIQQEPGFRDISARLSEFISPYSAHWRSPRDAQAQQFYHWKASGR